MILRGACASRAESVDQRRRCADALRIDRQARLLLTAEIDVAAHRQLLRAPPGIAEALAASVDDDACRLQRPVRAALEIERSGRVWKQRLQRRSLQRPCGVNLIVQLA